MNPDSTRTPREELELRLTALLLGELPADEAAAVRRALAQDAELAKLHDRLQATIGLVRETVTSQAEPLADQPPFKLSDERREKLLAHFKTVPLLPKLASVKKTKRSWLIPMSVAAVVVALIGIGALFLNPPRLLEGVTSDNSEDAYAFKRPEAVTPVPSAVPQSESAPATTAPTRSGDLAYGLPLVSMAVGDAVSSTPLHSADVVGYLDAAPSARSGRDTPGQLSEEAPSSTRSVTWSSGDPPSTRIVAPPTAGAFTATTPPPDATPARRPGSSIVLPSLSQSADGAKSAGAKYAVADQKGAGVLERPDQTRPEANRFLGRYAYEAKPTGDDALALAKPESWYFDNGAGSKSDLYGRLEGRSTALWDESSVTRGFYSDFSSRDSSGEGTAATRDQLRQNQGLAARGRGALNVGQAVTGLPQQSVNGLAAPGLAIGESFYGGYAMKSPAAPAVGLPASSRAEKGDVASFGNTDFDKISILGDTPQLGKQFYRLADRAGGGGGGGSGQAQPPPASASPAPQAGSGVVGTAVNEPRSVELMPFQPRLPASSLKGTPEDLPKGPNIEPLGTKPTGTVILGNPESAQEAGTSEQAAAFRRRYGLDLSSEQLAEGVAKQPAPTPAAPAVEEPATLNFGVVATKSLAPVEAKESETVAGRGITSLGSARVGGEPTLSAGDLTLQWADKQHQKQGGVSLAESDRKQVAELRKQLLSNGRELTEDERIAPAEKVQSMDLDALAVTTTAGKDVVGVAVEEAVRGQRPAIVLPMTKTGGASGVERGKTEELTKAEVAPRRPSSGTARSESARLVQDGKLLLELGKTEAAEEKLKEALEVEPENRAADYYLDLAQDARQRQSVRKNRVDTKNALVSVEHALAVSSAGKPRKLDDEIAKAQAEVDDLRVKLGISEADASGFGPAPWLEAETLRRLEGLRIESEARYVQEDKLLQELKQESPEELRRVLPTAITDPQLNELLQQLNLLEQGQISMSKDYSENHPSMVALARQMADTERKIDERTQGIMKGLEVRVASLKQHLNSLTANIESAKTVDPERAAANRPYLEAKARLAELVRARGSLVAQIRTARTNSSDKAISSAKEVDLPIRKPSTNAPIPQPEVQTSDNAFSTFSLNVSDVAFKLAAASLEKGQMPDAASVRTEEFINAFDYRDPEAPPGMPVAFAWERARYPFAHNRDLLRFSLKTAAAGRQAGRPLNLVLLLDNSGSMERADRVQIIREALRVLAGQLQPQDKLSVITFARTPRLWVDGVAGNKSGEVLDQVGGLTPQGGTNLEEAMNLAYATALRHYLAGGINRVVLLTDGAANLGNVEPESLKRKVEAHRKQGIAFDCFGIGWEGFNDDLLEVLSRNGDGRYGFINSTGEAATEFAGQLAGALKVAASDVKVQVEFNPKRVTAYRQIGYAKHQLTKEQFRDNTVDAAEIAAQEAGNALYTVEVNPAGEGPLCIVRCRFKIPGTSDYREHEWAVPYTGNAVSLEQASPAMRLAASASAFAEWLVVSPFAAEITPDALLSYLSGVPEVYGGDARPKKLEWMIRQAKSLAGK